MSFLVALLILIAASGCGRANTSPSSISVTLDSGAEASTKTGVDRGLAGEPARIALRDGARLVLERHCGSCHVPDSPTAFPGALAVYDLREEEWAHKMSQRQLEQLGWRIRDGALFDEFDVANKGKAPPPTPSDQEQQIVRDYVGAEIAARTGRR